jgi:transcriptional regulator with XRE-family HTH domain
MANRIKELREARGLTLQQVADAARTSLQQIQRMENSHRRLTDEWMRRIAPVLRVHPAELLLELPPGQNDIKQPIDDVLLVEWWHTLSREEQGDWILRFGRESGRTGSVTRRRRAAHNPKQRQA